MLRIIASTIAIGPNSVAKWYSQVALRGCTMHILVKLCVLMSISTVTGELLGSNVYLVSILESLQNLIQSSGCTGGLCTCAESNNVWSSVFTRAFSLPSLISSPQVNLDRIKERDRSYFLVYRLADSLPSRPDKIISTCRWPNSEIFSRKHLEVVDLIEKQAQTHSRSDEAEANVCKLIEEVRDPDPIGDIIEVPLLTLYDRYKVLYFEEKIIYEDTVRRQQDDLTEAEFEEWYNANQEILNNKVDSAYQKWEIFGSKRYVEQLLMEGGIMFDSSLLLNAVSSYRAVRQLLVYQYPDEEDLIPVTLSPEEWERAFYKNTQNSRDQLYYRLGQILLEIAAIDGASNASDVLNRTAELEELKTALDEAQAEIEQVVNRLQESRLLCRAGVGNCTEVQILEEMFTNTSQSFIAAYISFNTDESTLQTAEFDQRKSELSDRATVLENRLVLSSFNRSNETADSLSSALTERTVLFEWQAEDETLEEVASRLNSSNHIHTKPFLHLIASADTCDGCENCYTPWLEDTIPVKVSARLYFLTINREWFNPLIYENEYIISLLKEIRNETGSDFAPLTGSEDNILKSLQSSSFLLPHYPTTLVIATNIKITLKNVSNDTADAIYRGAYVSCPEVIGFGSFIIQNSLFETFDGKYRYSVEGMLDSSDGEVANALVISIDGAQIVGAQYKLLKALGSQETLEVSDNVNSMR